MPAPPIIDVWIQHPTPSLVADPMFASLRRWLRLTKLPDHIPTSLTMAALDAAKVSRALVTGWWGLSGKLIDNDEVAALVAEHPDRLVGVATVDLLRPMEAVRELRRAVRELGFVGLRLMPWLWRLPPNDRRYYPLYAECIGLGVPFCTQAGHAGPLLPSEPGRPIPYLDEVAADFPELTIVASHTGFPWADEMVSLARKYENVYIDTAAYKPSRYPESLVRFMRGSGRHKVLFGSDFPLLNPGVCLAELDQLELDEETQRLFLHDNAARIFGLEEPERGA